MPAKRLSGGVSSRCVPESPSAEPQVLDPAAEQFAEGRAVSWKGRASSLLCGSSCCCPERACRGPRVQGCSWGAWRRSSRRHGCPAPTEVTRRVDEGCVDPMEEQQQAGRCFPLQQQLRGLPGRLCVCRVESVFSRVSVPVCAGLGRFPPRAAAARSSQLWRRQPGVPTLVCCRLGLLLACELSLMWQLGGVSGVSSYRDTNPTRLGACPYS